MKYLSLFSGIGGFELGITQAYEDINSEEWICRECGCDDTHPCEGGCGWKEPNLCDRHELVETSATSLPRGDSSEPESGRRFGEYAPHCIGYSEIDKYAIQIYQKHFPEHKNWGNVRDIDAEQLPDFDLLAGGFPCQAFSIAGKRKGFEDARGTLFYDIARIAKAKQPMLMLLENVKGLVSHDGGKTLEVILESLQELGYYVNYEIRNSKDYGVPQNRERIFFTCKHIKLLSSVGQSEKITTSESIIQEWLFQLLLNNLAEVKKLQEHASKDWVVGWLLLKEIESVFGQNPNLPSSNDIMQSRLQNSKNSSQISLFTESTTRQGSLAEKRNTKDGITTASEESKSLSEEESLWQNIDTYLNSILGENSSELNKSTISTAIRQIIESRTYTFTTMSEAILLATVLLRGSSKSLWNEILLSLIVIQEGTKYARINNTGEEVVITESGIAHIASELQEFAGRFFINHLRGTSRPQVFPLTGGNSKNLEQLIGGHQGNRVYGTDGISTTIASQAGGQGAKTGLYATGIDTGGLQTVATSIDANYHKGHGQRGKSRGRTLALQDTKIRRLTPTECERLQGFPDGWTEGVSDTQRYKCLGNAVTVNVIREIVKRL